MDGTLDQDSPANVLQSSHRIATCVGNRQRNHSDRPSVVRVASPAIRTEETSQCGGKSDQAANRNMPQGSRAGRRKVVVAKEWEASRQGDRTATIQNRGIGSTIQIAFIALVISPMAGAFSLAYR
jgi:hypothetical protein